MTLQLWNGLSPRVRVDRDGPVLIVTLDEPRRLNALDAQAQHALDVIWREFFSDPAFTVAMITGSGDRAFCAGADMAALKDADDIAAEEPRSEYGHYGLSHRLSLPKPIVGAINGAALGGGFELALCCDILIASETASFGLPEPMMGGAALAGGIARLSRRIPAAIAAEVVLACRTLTAADAFRLGLVNDVVPSARLRESALAQAHRIAATAPLARAATKTVLDAALRGDPLAGLLELGDSLVGSLMSSDDVREGLAAFQAKRPPQWQGR